MKFINVLLLVTFVLAEETTIEKEVTTVKIEDNNEATTIKEEIGMPTEVIFDTNPVNIQSSTELVQLTDSVENETNESTESSEESQENLQPSVSPVNSKPQRRKVLYVNQQQHGKLNVQFELNDVSLIVIPTNKDPQLSLLNLLLKSAQKSSLMNEQKKKEEITKVNEDDYSKYNYMHTSTNEPSIESRAPYRVDISSTLNSQPIVEITHPSEEVRVTASPMLKVKKPIVFQSPLHNKSQRSIPFVGKENEVNVEIIPDNEEIINSIGDADNLDEFAKEDVDTTSEFVLLGATENCGPGRRRNSYQICVPETE